MPPASLTSADDSPSIEAVELPHDGVGGEPTATSDATMTAPSSEPTAAAAPASPDYTPSSPTPLREDEVDADPLPGEPWLAGAYENQHYACASGLTVCTQPAGYLTDYLVAVECAVFGCVLVGKGSHAPSARPVDASAWLIGFLFAAAVSAALGGAIHHVAHRYVNQVADVAHARRVGDADAALNAAWGAVLWVSSLPNLFMFAAATWLVAQSQPTAWVVFGCGAAGYLAVACFVAVSRKIIVHIAVSLPTIVYFLAASAYRHHKTSSHWNIAGAALLIGCGVVTKGKLALSKAYFNHNAVMHCVLFLANACFFVSVYSDLD